MSTIDLHQVYVKEAYVIGGKLEIEGPIGRYLNEIYIPDKRSFETNELSMVDMALCGVSLRNVDYLIAGDLSNQIAISSFAASYYSIPFIGIYSACASMNLALGLAAMTINASYAQEICCYTSSYNQTAERQFRYPVEYGGAKVDSQTSTSSVAVAVVLTNLPSKVKVSRFTIGKVVDIDFTDALDMGRCMVPAAIESILEHFKNTHTKPKDYDLILTGDLSKYGSKIFEEELAKDFGSFKYFDCGLLLYDINQQAVFAGGSGPGTVAAVTWSKIYQELREKKYKRVLICATGALLSQTSVAQKRSIPSICHIIELEACQ